MAEKNANTKATKRTTSTASDLKAATIKAAATSKKSSSSKTSTGKNTTNKNTTGKSTSKTGAVKSTGTKTTGTKSNSGAKATTKNRKNVAAQEKQLELELEKESTKKEFSEDTKKEIRLIIGAVIAVLLILSNFNLCGSLGEIISSFIFGLMGIFAYIFPFFMFYAVTVSVSKRYYRRNIGNILIYIVFILDITALIQMIYGYNSEWGFKDYYIYSAETRAQGGFLASVFCKTLCPLVDKAATIIILVAVLLICIMLVTGKAIFKYIKKFSDITIEKGKEFHKQRQLEYEEFQKVELEREEEEGRRRATVVNFKDYPENKKDDEQADAADEVLEADEPEDFLDTLRKMGRKEESVIPEPVVEPKVDFEVKNIEKLSDVRPEKVTEVFEEKLGDQVSEIYEDELRKKFGNHNTADTSEGEIKITNMYDTQRIKAEAAAEYTTTSEVVSTLSPKVVPFKALTAHTESRNDSVNDDKAFARASSGSGTFTDDSLPPSGPTRPSRAAETQNAPQSTAVKDNTKDNGQLEIDIEQIAPPEKPYVFPPIELLNKPKENKVGISNQSLQDTAMKLKNTLESFGVHVKVTDITCGPTVTRIELQPEQGVKVSQITRLTDDIKLNLAAAEIRMEAPIPGKAAIGIEVPNGTNSTVMLRELIENDNFQKHSSAIAFAVGKDIGGQVVVSDIGKMPHLLIAGATGSGKSVCINTLVMSILYKAKPSDVRLIMVDPKIVELSVYNGIPHLLIPVVTDPKKAAAALNWAVKEMDDRYQKFADLQVRDLKSYNEKIEEEPFASDASYIRLPQIVIIVDELADLMMVAPGDVEEAICRLAQKARAAGLHLVIATQRPSVNVITGLIKANVPSRIAFSVSSQIDSRTILDGAGAEKLLGKGDMLFFPSGYPKPARVQGAFVSDKEVNDVVEFLKEENSEPKYNDEVSKHITESATPNNAQDAADISDSRNSRDEYFVEAGRFIIEKEKASIGMLQRVYRVGFNRAARIMEQLADAGVVGPEEGTKPRKILMTMEEFDAYVDEYV